MNESGQTLPHPPQPLLVAAGADRFGAQRGLGISAITFKLASQEGGGTFILENTFHDRGGPARHLHYEQDEWFYGLEGVFRFGVGDMRLTLQPGDALLAPRMVPHVWAYTGPGTGAAANATGRILIAFLPAGKMEAFFQEVTRANAMPAQDPALWRAHGMELLGPPLVLEDR